MRIRPDMTPVPARGSVLIIVLWVAFGLVSIALYFAHSMSMELRASDNRLAGLEANQAVEGAARYAAYILAHVEEPGVLPDPMTYQSDNVPVGEATFWFIGRDTNSLQISPTEPVFGLVDEASKLNLNTVPAEMLEALPRMTPELAAAIVDWRDSDSTVSSGGAEDETYLRLNPPYRCKNGPFESVDELRLVHGMNLEILYGEDANQNGVLDPNENDGEVSLPYDNRDGRLDPGLAEYVTIYSREPNTRASGEPRFNISTGIDEQLFAVIEERLGPSRANDIRDLINGVAPGGGGPEGGQGPGGQGGGQNQGGGGQTNGVPQGGAGVSYSSLLDFFADSGMTPDEFARIEGELTVSDGAFIEGRINVNTASEAVLACIPGIGPDRAPTLVSHRQSNESQLPTIGWVYEALDRNRELAVQVGPYITSRSFQYTADIAATGHHGRGYRRKRFVLDTSETTPRILYRQDLTRLGWALGSGIREELLLAGNLP